METTIEKKSVDQVNSLVLGSYKAAFADRSTSSLNSYIQSNTTENTCPPVKDTAASCCHEDSSIIKDAKRIIIEQYKVEIISTIRNDTFEDGSCSQSELFMAEQFKPETSQYIRTALNELYIHFYSNSHIITGILIMAGSISYDLVFPEGPTMALGLLQHYDYQVRDRAIQAFERWNCKKGLVVLESLRCDKKWMQRYVDKVIEYIKRDGVD